MPFRSKRQQRFMYATKPKGVDLKEWAKETDFSKLPEKVRKRKKKEKEKNKNDKDKKDTSDAPMTLVDKVLVMALEFEKQIKLSSDH